jgi:hypothetical protein
MTRISDPRQLTALGPARPLLEREFQTQVRGLARQCRWDLIVHFPSVLTMAERGWPDLFAARVRDRRIVFAELKRQTGALRPRQMEVLEILRGLAWPRCMCSGPIAGPFGAGATPDGKIHDSGCPAIGGAFSGLATRVEVFVWRPSDWPQIVEVLR